MTSVAALADTSPKTTSDNSAGAAFSIWEIPFDGWTVTKYARFMAYHQTHKFIWKQFEKLALELIADGETHWSADALLHVVRFTCRKEKNPSEKYIVNNNFSCGYSLAFERKYPQHSEFFETREIKDND